LHDIFDPERVKQSITMGATHGENAGNPVEKK
jgi:hypothetical protein